jgi:hypothetical protein
MDDDDDSEIEIPKISEKEERNQLRALIEVWNRLKEKEQDNFRGRFLDFADKTTKKWLVKNNQEFKCSNNAHQFNEEIRNISNWERIW